MGPGDTWQREDEKAATKRCKELKDSDSVIFACLRGYSSSAYATRRKYIHRLHRFHRFSGQVKEELRKAGTEELTTGVTEEDPEVTEEDAKAVGPGDTRRRDETEENPSTDCTDSADYRRAGPACAPARACALRTCPGARARRADRIAATVPLQAIERGAPRGNWSPMRQRQADTASNSGRAMG